MIVIQDYDRTVTYVRYNPSTNAFTSSAPLVSSAVGLLDVAPYEDDPANGWLVLYDAGGSLGGTYTFGSTVRLEYWTSAGRQTYVDTAVAGGYTLTWGGYVAGRYGQSVWSLWSTIDTFTAHNCWAQSRAADHSFSSIAGPTQFETLSSSTGGGLLTGAVHLGSDKVFVTYVYRALSGASGPNTWMCAWRVLRTSGGGIGFWAFGRIPLGLIPSTRPFVASGEVYQPFFYDLNYGGSYNPCRQPTLYLCKFEGVADSMSSTGTIVTDVCRPVATVAPRQVSTSFQGLIELFNSFHRGFASSVDRNATQIAVGLKTKGPGEGGDASAPSGTFSPAGPSWAAEFFWDAASRRELYQANELGGALAISGGVPFVTEGQSAFEDGFFNYPEFSYVSTTGSGCALPTGQYSFAIIYRAVDSSGAVQRSAPYICAPVSVAAGGAYPQINITPPIASYRDAPASPSTVGKIAADIYMTTTNGATLYYAGSVTVSNLISWPTVVTTTFNGLPDTTAPILYTTGGVMDNVNPPASKIQITHQKRKAIVDETLRGVWFSKAFVEGEAPGFNEALYVAFPEGGDITALGSFEGKFFAFKSRSIWLMDGEGPAVTGQGASWTTPAALTTDVGCKSWQSVVAMPNGLMFQAPNNGIYLLGRDLQVSFIGKNVIDRTNAYPNIVSATLVPLSTQIRFICQDTAGTGHLVVVYDYLLDQWTTHQYGQMSAVPVSSCVSFGSTPQYTVLSSDGNLWQERLSTDANRYFDQDSSGTNHFVSTSVTTPYVKMQVQGFQKARRVQFFGEQQDDCGLQMQLAFNYDDTVRQTATWSSSQLKSLNVRGQVETFVGAAYNKGMSVQVTFTDTPGTAMTNGAGMRFVSTALELVNLGPRYRLLPAGARR